ncbi:hypothetical protein KAR91_67105 [Candidatus Pacearchaeota archaeon]|nr:hypothetical protein [Candidatus Pacearchaeota archaeon]
MWYSPYEKRHEVICKKHPKHKVMRQPLTGCVDCWIVWIERNLFTEIRGSSKRFMINALQQFAKQGAIKVNNSVKERSIEEIVDDDSYADLIKGT